MLFCRPLTLSSVLLSAASLLPVTGAQAQQPALAPSGAAPARLAYLSPPEAPPPPEAAPPDSMPRYGRTQVALRIGGAGPYSGGVLTGLDITLPRASIGPGWVGRLDLDSWGISVLGSSTSSTAVTFSQISSTSGRMPDVYYGLGLGFVLMSDDDHSGGGPAGKVTLGFNLGGHLALEGSVIGGGGVTNGAGMLRLRF